MFWEYPEMTLEKKQALLNVENQDDEIEEKTRENNFSRLKKIATGLGLIIVTILLFFIFKIDPSLEKYKAINILVLFLFLIGFLTLEKLGKKASFPILLLTVFITSIVNNTYRDITEVKYLGKYSNVSINTEDSVRICCDTSNYYIGHTSKFLFIHSEKNEETVVKKLSEAKDIRFYSGKNKY